MARLQPPHRHEEHEDMRRREEGESRLPRAPELVTNLAEDRSGPTAPRGLLQSQIGRRRGGLVPSLRDGRLEHRDTERRSEGSARPHWQEGGAEDGRTQLPRVSRTRLVTQVVVTWWLRGGGYAPSQRGRRDNASTMQTARRPLQRRRRRTASLASNQAPWTWRSPSEHLHPTNRQEGSEHQGRRWPVPERPRRRR